MGEQGKIAILDGGQNSGKRCVLPDGKLALFDADGDCKECCWQWEAEATYTQIVPNACTMPCAPAYPPELCDAPLKIKYWTVRFVDVIENIFTPEQLLETSCSALDLHNTYQYMMEGDFPDPDDRRYGHHVLELVDYSGLLDPPEQHVYNLVNWSDHRHVLHYPKTYLDLEYHDANLCRSRVTCGYPQSDQEGVCNFITGFHQRFGVHGENTQQCGWDGESFHNMCRWPLEDTDELNSWNAVANEFTPDYPKYAWIWGDHGEYVLCGRGGLAHIHRGRLVRCGG